ncbi:MAG: radical SAM protein, partial [Deltaproteobacteria bacterium]|nr:radical SAM protein [Deltaproteobacteria bacterium]
MKKNKLLGRYAANFLENVTAVDRLNFLIFFITSACNCRCSTCFYWQSLNKTENLSLAEIKKVSASMGRFRTLLLSGGEPFMRNDIAAVCSCFIEQNGIAALAVPTNCTLPERIVPFVEDMLRRYPHLTLSINPSLDGLRETHDAMRGKTGVFEKVVETVTELSRIRRRHPKLEIVINTVISEENAGEIDLLGDLVYNEMDCDYHEFEILRGDPRDGGLKAPPIAEIRRLHGLIVRNRERYLKRRGAGEVERFAEMGLLLYSQKVKERVLDHRGLPVRCTAGRNIGVLEPDGGVRLCELLPAIGNVREAGYDFLSVWNSPRAMALRENIRATDCACTHVCFIKLSGAAHIR